MPAITPPSKVLVTGASGFIAAWTVKALLERGFAVVGTVRSSSKGEYLSNLFREHEGRFEYVIVEDMEKEGAFDEAVKGVDAVEHTASPVSFVVEDPQGLIRPAILGTVGVLTSVMKHGPNVKRVVITGSVGSIIHDKGGPAVFTEEDWNIDSPAIIEREGPNAPGLHKYRASKTLAEKAAWEFVEKNKEQMQFDLVVLCPPLVFGPFIHEVHSLSSLSLSLVLFRSFTNTKAPKPQSELLTPSINWVDVRDVAVGHTLALEKEAAGGQRLIISAGPFVYQDILDALHTPTPRDDVPKGISGAGKAIKLNVFDSSKAREVLGITFRGMEDMASATLKSLKDHGF